MEILRGGSIVDDLIRIPCVLMRGGTSKGPYFIASDLPTQIEARDRVLVSAMGAGNLLEIDGIGGGHPLTSKVAIVSPSRVPGADVDYLFAQVRVEQRLVDTSPNCGNMIAGVGPFAIEAGMVSAQDGETRVRIFNVNTGKLIEAKVATPGRQVVYDGNASIDGVPGTAAPIHLAFLGAAGSKTGKLLPTGRPLDRVNGIEVSCVDAAMPVVLIRASDLGKTGYETPAEFSADREFMRRLEALRIEAGKLMGIPDAADRVIPKPVLIAPPAKGGTISARYFMPHSCHAALAITGSVAVATAAVTPGTLAHAIVGDHALPVMFGIEHPSGRLEVTLDHHPDYVEPAAYVVRTARRLFEGHVLVKASEIYLASSTAA